VASKVFLTSLVGDDLDRTVNELFEDILITRWRPSARTRNFGDAFILEDDEAYRVRIALPAADPQDLDVEVSNWRLLVSIPIPAARTGLAAARQQRTFDFAHSVEIERVKARFENGTLEIFLPKSTSRKIDVQ
jgi:HSP20 family molecular chaperone IbpA